MQPTLLKLLAKQPQSAKELTQQLNISQPTLSRLVKQQPAIIKIGKARATQYALQRPIRDIGSQWPVYRVNEQANISLAGQLIAIYPHSFVWHDALTQNDTLYESLPWFLWDIRPQGFLGREFSAIHQQLGLNPRLQDWQDDDVLTFLLKFGFVQPSHFLVGEESCLSFLRLQQDVLQPDDDDGWLKTRASYGQEACKVIRHDIARSSAAGEQPKFGLFVLESQQTFELLVKFSPPLATVNGQRWSDLLIAEHLALQTLQHFGIAAAQSQIVQTAGRTFLEVLRFDRTTSFGRKGMVSLEAVSNEFIGHNKAWDEQAKSLLALNKINVDDYQNILKVFSFGRLIANEDMHNGNLSFFLAHDFSLSLAPVYDMLPMRFAPTIHGEVVEREIKPVQASALSQHVWSEVCVWATYYWQQVAKHPQISDEFRAIAEQYGRMMS
ncbi:MAG TPA: type II toxin-antitoxin system HipA family toxin YjjJ [Agitococcus sp.]|nr:type II toxin-antitoxin system HipA family toxin YjjJ [Agitococcus sp.]